MTLLSAVVVQARRRFGGRSTADEYERRVRSARPESVPRSLMRVPLKTETDAFRVAVALGLLAGASIIVGLLASRAYGVVMFAAGIAAGVTFELAGRESERVCAA
jgi:hypothetical protein